MAAAATDYFQKVAMSTATTLSSPGYTTGATSINVGSTSNWPTDTGITFAIDEIDSAGLRVSGSYNVFRGTVNTATQITNITYVGGDANRNYSAGATTRVYILVSYAQMNRMIDGLLVSHDQDGTLKNASVDGYDVLATVVKRYTSAEYAPQGYMQNGQIQTFAVTNDLIVVIKTLAGNDPSASDPVLVRIGNTVRSITSALSFTLLDGTNWFNSGSTSLATFEVDYFCYLGWRASTSTVFIGAARIPYGRTYADFSSTNTNEKYLAYSGAAPASTDEVEVVGRFNATLSATAAFNWSIPATSVIVNRPIFETRALTYAPQPTGITLGNGTVTGRYQIISRRCLGVSIFTHGTTSSHTGALSVSTPITVSTSYTSETIVGVGTIIDAGTTVFYTKVSISSATTLAQWLENSAGTYGSRSATTTLIPMTWANTDQSIMPFDYEMA